MMRHQAGSRARSIRVLRPATIGITLAMVVLPLGATRGIAANPEIVFPEAAGTTIIHGEGIVGITLMLPEPVRIFQESLSIEFAEEAKYVWTGFRSHVEPDSLCDFCLRNTVRVLPEVSPAPTKGRCSDEQGNEVGCLYQARELELYFATDAPATLTISLPELSGSIELDATAEVDGFLEELPVTGCAPMPDCSQGHFYGGKSRTIGLDGPAMAGVAGYLVTDEGALGTTNPGLHGLDVCAYPSTFDPGGSGDPTEHPNGCDNDVPPGIGTGGEFQVQSEGTQQIHGQQYLGFRVWNRRLLADAVFGVWGRWLEAGMTCRSFDYHDCTKPPPTGA